MILVAVLLLPLLSVLLLVMDRVEDRVLAPAPVRGRHAGHRRHLRLIPGGRRGTEADAGGPASEPGEGPAGEPRRAA
ncbi:hypothetical protein C1I97_21785 [Streptomyces sp. NTH33]|uniref:hypothetical protein n=1 Tax=Streptomyces sp. NTH33 TaxID=1735453 RepID=UPI000DA902A2|nr:hypothetical protein [Streptomyces sp. NTH33]PZH02155.1 hypothetical protein C1I97_21785 [Streptomyces sp. NTH33]